jgi:hypothetical protein
MNDPIVAYVGFVDGVRRPVVEQMDGRQYVSTTTVSGFTVSGSFRAMAPSTYRSS